MSDYSKETAKFRGEKLTKVEFNDVFRLLKRWLEVNNIKVDDISDLTVYAEADDSYRKTFSFSFRPRYLDSKEYNIRGDEPVDLEGLIAERQGYETK
jgi:hypothetical protein